MEDFQEKANQVENLRDLMSADEVGTKEAVRKEVQRVLDRHWEKNYSNMVGVAFAKIIAEDPACMIRRYSENAAVDGLINLNEGADGLDMVGDNTVFCSCLAPCCYEGESMCLNCQCEFGYGPPEDARIFKRPKHVDTPSTPVCDRWAQTSEERETIMGFFDFLCGKRFLLYEHVTRPSGFEDCVPCMKSGDELIAEYLHIDLKELDNERRALLDAIQKANEQEESEKPKNGDDSRP